ncbi:MAG: DUF3347 domain-containing protein [Bacteroidales bacterium]
MKNLIAGIVISAAVLGACSGNRSSKNEGSVATPEMAEAGSLASAETPVIHSKTTISVKEIVDPYLKLKNALTSDNSPDASNLGTLLGAAMKKFDKTSLDPEHMKIFDDIQADAAEHAEHIAANSGDIEHQREHFEMLSTDIYDLVKVFSAGQVLYKEFCPMYNNGKGAFWLSESKEIKNPYFGSEMPTCGVVKEIVN